MSATYPSLNGRCVFITGGASGIGAAFVRAFANQGSHVAFIDKQADVGLGLAGEHNAWFRALDVTKPNDLTGAIDEAAASVGPFSVLINNVADDTRQDATELDSAAWRASLAVNLDPVMITARSIYPMMREAGGGCILNLSSINAQLGPARLGAYVAAKAAILGLTKALAREWGADNVRVNAISPGWVVTERQLNLWLTPEAEADWTKQTALKARIRPEDVAALALFLASDEASMITGQNFVIDGGRT